MWTSYPPLTALLSSSAKRGVLIYQSRGIAPCPVRFPKAETPKCFVTCRARKRWRSGCSAQAAQRTGSLRCSCRAGSSPGAWGLAGRAAPTSSRPPERCVVARGCRLGPLCCCVVSSGKADGGSRREGPGRQKGGVQGHKCTPPGLAGTQQVPVSIKCSESVSPRVARV